MSNIMKVTLIQDVIDLVKVLLIQALSIIVFLVRHPLTSATVLTDSEAAILHYESFLLGPSSRRLQSLPLTSNHWIIYLIQI